MAEILNLKSALEMVGGETDFLKELLKAFLEDKCFDPFHLKNLEEQEDKTEAAKYVHYFKGAGRQLGAELLGEAGQELENILRGKTSGNIEESTKNFVSIYTKTMDAIKEEYRKL